MAWVLVAEAGAELVAALAAARVVAIVKKGEDKEGR